MFGVAQRDGNEIKCYLHKESIVFNSDKNTTFA